MEEGKESQVCGHRKSLSWLPPPCHFHKRISKQADKTLRNCSRPYTLLWTALACWFKQMAPFQTEYKASHAMRCGPLCVLLTSLFNRTENLCEYVAICGDYPGPGFVWRNTFNHSLEATDSIRAPLPVSHQGSKSSLHLFNCKPTASVWCGIFQ